MIELKSSLREKSPSETLKLCKPVARELGISRVTEVTQLDIFDIPVFASIRPDAAYGSLCVNAGKGFSKIDAKVGAYMEAIEFAFAEFKNNQISLHKRFPTNLYPNESDRFILEFCPRINTSVAPSSKIGVVKGMDILNDTACYIPAELIFLPCPKEISLQQYFGSNSNGLSSGNTRTEAILHGILEVIERDIASFQFFKDQSYLVPNNSLSNEYDEVLNTVRNHKYELFIRYSKNIFGIPYFSATIGSYHDPNPIYINEGFGCHMSKEIALNRAITECFQSRLSFIHGGRDDLDDAYNRHKNYTPEMRNKYAIDLLNERGNPKKQINFNDINSFENNINSIDNALDYVMTLLKRLQFDKIIVVPYTQDDFPIQVVRVIIPKMEFFNVSSNRLGIRLKDYVQANPR